MPSRAAALSLALVLALAACADPPVTPHAAATSSRKAVDLAVHASVAANVVALVVEVTGPGIASPVVANLAVSNGTASGTVSVPVGANRTFMLRAFDAQGIETHTGSTTVTVVPGQNTILTVTLVPVTAGVPIQATVGSYAVSVSPAATTVLLLATTTFTATVTDASGAVIASSATDPSQFTWASYNPIMLSIDAAGVATANLAGSTRVVANYAVGGFSAEASVTVLSSSSVVPVSLAAGSDHACAVSKVLELWCWGANSLGQLGTGVLGSSPVPTKVPLSTPHNVVAVTAGEGHTCVLRTGGALMCWGANNAGQFGNGTTVSSAAPVAVPAPPGVTLVAIDAGLNHTCALASDGTAYCWGDNAQGQLGDGTRTQRLAMTPVPGVTFSGISAGPFHTCGVSAAAVGASPAGTVFCWGSNSTGALGDQTQTDRLTPTPVAGGTLFTSVSAGSSSTCAVATTGGAYCWGFNPSGQLGDGTYVDRYVPTPVIVAPPVAAIAAGNGAACARTAAGAVWCWGFSVYYSTRLASGLYDVNATPLLMAGVGPALTVAAGKEFFCVTTGAAQVECAGNGNNGQRGTSVAPGPNQTFTPVSAPAGVAFRAP